MANKAAKGWRAKTRHKISGKGSKVTVNQLLKEIPVGSKVDIKIKGSMQNNGMPFRRYHGMTGTVVGKQGTAFKIALYNGNQPVELLIGPAHLTVSKGSGPVESAVHVHAHKKAEEKVAA
ncbi:MAG TPA: 50S ribosomal protein L21e [archaeon]|nr:50S ribosomal protein L21e [archaeon]